MHFHRTFPIAFLAAVAFPVLAQQSAQPELKVDASNRTLVVSAQGEVSVEPEIAVLHIGFETQPGDAKSVYADGAHTSNTIIDALKGAGIPEADIRSEMQHLDRDYSKPHKFKLVQQWTVRAPAGRAAEILDVAITNGANSSGEIEWTVKDERVLDDQALSKAADRARADAATLAQGMGVHLGRLVFVSNQLSERVLPIRPMAMAMNKSLEPSQPLSIEPQKVTRSASVYAIFSIE